MNKILNFMKRNLKELLRDPIICIFCLAFPIIMLALFQIINNYTGGNTPMFEMKSLLPAIIMFSYSFVMLALAQIVSKDRQTFFLKRLYSTPMRPYQFIFGYFFVGIIIGIMQTLTCIIFGLIISLISKTAFISFWGIVLVALSQIPMLLICVFLGILFGTLFSDKSAPGVCSLFINVSGILGGCWMPIEAMGKFELICRLLPFYPSVYIGRVATVAQNSFGATYQFDSVAKLGTIPIMIFLLVSAVLSIVFFKRSMTSDK
ncbi:MAG: ABC transporter permease [Clostridia bacterium]|nr:ABC transporter permease [Clostridia bacterium]